MRALELSEVHRRHVARLRGLPAIVDGGGLRIGRQFVMFFAEADLMREHAARLTDGCAAADVLEVGLGLGVFAEQLMALDVASYTAIEPHPGVAALTRRRVLDAFAVPVTVYPEPWQLVELPRCYDAIMYDTWPPDGHADADFADFVRCVAVPSLRAGGRFSFFNSGDEISPVRGEILDHHFAEWTAYPYELPVELVPPHWTKPTRDFLIPIATKGSA